jgi:hypothetical protein
MKGAAKDGYKFVFVIDNLDRISEAEALQVWGTIKGFFLGPSDEGETSRPKYLPSIILPLDPKSILRMFTQEHGDDAPELTQAFMEKTFDVTFDLPAPVASDWQEYLARMARFAFGKGLRTTDVYWIATYLDEKRRTEGVLVTPRVVNTFVNGVLAQYLQRSSPEISIPVVAYYYALLRDAEDFVSLLSEPRRPLPPRAELEN